MDGDKGMKSAFDEVFHHARRFLCSDHRSLVIGRNTSGDTGTKVFWRLIFATTNASFQHRWATPPTGMNQLQLDNAIACISQVESKYQFPLSLYQEAPTAETLHGHTASQGVESMNRANLALRSFGGDMISFVMECVMLHKVRYEKGKERSSCEYEDNIPPRICEKIQKILKSDEFDNITSCQQLSPFLYNEMHEQTSAVWGAKPL
eukprot:CAMPEP_0205946550 /NCGR_PEP_ID=MMETSP1325-20131115/69105_1 /ASSEMBLY_ACC=CAM_ASM_000708 /TAXON_ID=236786 /ORGANISM="Florenciella sp., Strain RCC1007" /LENGTH=205 /DNA_ID=CAMNT_0053317631 /DNA_START=96 /DNA_END=713 /DNA_ORIENTATION=-